MLKTFSFSVLHSELLNKSCGEIICQSETSFFIVCKVCNIKIFEYSEFVEHIRVVHWPQILCAKNEEGKLPTEENHEREDFPCRISNINIKKWDGNEEDPTKHLASVLKQEDCEVNENNDSNECTGKDREISKGQQKEFTCPQCSRTFRTKFYLKFHVRQQHTPKEFQCEKCDKSFTEERYLKLHLRSHDGYVCKQCGLVFEKYEALRYHQENHIETRDFICDFEGCGKGFPTNRRLCAHRRNHFVQPSYVCEICGSRQRSKEFLIVHIRTHTGEKPYACTLCDRKFASKHFLTEHKVVHTTERSHVCDVCGKAFAARKSLYHHRHLHADVKKFMCKICDRSYSQAAGLSAHMRKHKQNCGLLEKSL